MTPFDQWFEDSFRCTVPQQYAAFLEAHPKGRNGAGGAMYGAGDVIAFTEERDLVAKGVCFIGARSLETFLLRAHDGRIFVVDSTDYSHIDAWFANIDCVMNLMHFK